MTSASTRVPAEQAVNARVAQQPQPPELRPVRRKRSRLLILVGLVLSAVCAVGAVWVYQNADQTYSAVGVAKRVPYGQPITEDALREVRVHTDPGVAPLRWEQRAELVGKPAGTDLLPGSLVTPDAVAAGGAPPKAGEHLVGIAVKASQLPVTPLQSRQPVLLVPSSGEATGGDAALWEPVRAVVLRVGEREASGVRVVDVIVPEGDGPTMATRASTGKVAIIVVPRG